ncbi:7-deoxyloganetic acid glucosyltransferase [Thalictrum thalictroides]|uniref:7-deoxyloganetic acid glucosyltransferase n=1 Tax=Thalictrum thalictroides TaxID=46969 RepID=A0A7J6VYE4_THATH|nr:7-deoxyloganetic acid glucosyltransferase [Thalictrum thalictroides]
MEPSFVQLLHSNYFQSVNRPPVTCIITDGLMSFPIVVAKQLGIKSMNFRPTGASFLWCCYNHLKMIEAGELPFEDSDMDKLITSIPDLEAPILSKMRPHFPKIYTLSPLHAHLSTVHHNGRSGSSNNSLCEVDRNCITWLDSQPSKSVVYVSFGSIVMMTHKQMLEFWYGLVNSGKRFLWAIRPDSVIDKDEKYQIPDDLTAGTEQRGYIVGWSPQEEVLAHPSIGGFLTHSGWGSVLVYNCWSSDAMLAANG